MASERSLRLQAARCRTHAAGLRDTQEAAHFVFLADFLEIEAEALRGSGHAPVESRSPLPALAW